jgi:hypothetical protein
MKAAMLFDPHTASQVGRAPQAMHCHQYLAAAMAPSLAWGWGARGTSDARRSTHFAPRAMNAPEPRSNSADHPS